MATTQRFDTAYGLSQPLLNEFPAPIVSNRAPTTADKAQLGSLWVDKPSNEAWVLTSVVSNVATWVNIGGGSGTFSSITVTPGNLTVTNGNITATLGDITAGAGNIDAVSGSVTAGTTVTAGTGLTVTTGNVTVSAGNVIVTGSVTASSATSGQSIVATGDHGTGFATFTTMTNVVNTTQSTGTLSIVSGSTNNGNNTGFLKFYVGLTPVFVPYFDTIAP